MAAGPLPEMGDTRYAPYVGELREFFATSGVRFGSPEDIVAVVHRLSAPGTFAADLGSLIRSFVLREGGAMPYAQLLEIISFAIAGPQLAHAPQPYSEPLRQLLAFLTGALRRPWNVPPSDPAEVIPFPAPNTGGTSAHTSEPAAGAAKVPVAVFEQLRGEQLREEQIREEKIRGDRGDEPQSESESRAVPVPEPQREDRVSEETVESVQASSHGVSSWRLTPLRRNILLGAGVSFALVALLIQGLHRHPDAETIRAVPAITAAPSTAVPSTSSTPAVAPDQEPASAAGPVITQQTMVPAKPAISASAYSAPGVSHPRQQTTPGVNSQVAGNASSPAVNVGPTAHPYPVTPENGRASGAPIVRLPPGYHAPDASLARNLPADQIRSAARPTTYSTVSSGVMAGYLIFSPVPNYPRLAHLAHIQGQVILQAVIARDGSVATVRVLRGNRLLRGAAKDAVLHWRYRPYRLAGKPVDVATIITVDFHDRG